MGLVHGGPPRELVLGVRDELGVDTFVETGTYKGDTAAWAAEHFARVVTIEASEELHEHAVRAHGHLANVAFELGDSREVLPRVVAGLERPALFWLDGHWCGGETFGGEADQCPLLGELEAVRSSTLPHALFVDDARLFLSPPPHPHDAAQWPTIDQVVDGVRDAAHDRYVAVIEDVLVAVPREAAVLVAAYGQEASTREWEAFSGHAEPERSGELRRFVRAVARRASVVRANATGLARRQS